MSFLKAQLSHVSNETRFWMRLYFVSPFSPLFFAELCVFHLPHTHYANYTNTTLYHSMFRWVDPETRNTAEDAQNSNTYFAPLKLILLSCSRSSREQVF